jgi:PPOX class probable F420-dependent enzyme
VTDFPESHRYLLDAKVASLATLRADGFPQLTEVWFLHQAGELALSLNDSRRKTRNLIARPQCSLLLLDVANPDRYLEVRALARIEPDREYGGVDLRTLDGPGEQRVKVTLEPVNVYAVDVSSIGDGASRS